MAEQQIFNSLIEFFEEDGWEFQWVAGISALSMGFSGRNGKWLCYAQARETEEQFAFYSVLAVNVPLNKRHKVAEFITRVNYGMVIGNFEMDYEDGEVRYKTSIDVEGAELGASMIRQVVYANLIITDRYLPGIMRVIYSEETPVEILDSIELMNEYEDDFMDDAFLVFDDESEDDEFDDDYDDEFDPDFDIDYDDDDDDDFDDFDDFDELPPFDSPPDNNGGSMN
ncbi:MAG: YbjN domain-containing protein [Anaerolineae bacterium]